MSLVLDGTAGVTFPASQTPSMTAYQGGVLTSGTAVASTSGTSIDFTSIPSWVKRITVMFNGVSTNGTSPVLVQVGSGSVSTSGYYSLVALINGSSQYSSTAGLVVDGTSSANAGYTRSGIALLTLIGNNQWIYSVTQSYPVALGNTSNTGGGFSPALSGALDRVRITTVNGTDTFDAGSINILYE